MAEDASPQIARAAAGRECKGKKKILGPHMPQGEVNRQQRTTRVKASHPEQACVLSHTPPCHTRTKGLPGALHGLYGGHCG